MLLNDIAACPRTSDIEDVRLYLPRYCVACEVQSTEATCFVCGAEMTLEHDGWPPLYEHQVLMRERAERERQ